MHFCIVLIAEFVFLLKMSVLYNKYFLYECVSWVLGLVGHVGENETKFQIRASDMESSSE